MRFYFLIFCCFEFLLFMNVGCQPICMRDPRKVDRRLSLKNLRPIEDCVRRFFVRSKNLQTLIKESSIAVFERSLRYLLDRSYRRVSWCLVISIHIFFAAENDDILFTVIGTPDLWHWRTAKLFHTNPLFKHEGPLLAGTCV